MAPAGYWQRRNARAKELGYRNYYDYRAHDNGRIPPGRPQLRGARLAQARGHRSAADLERLLRAGRVELVSTVRTVDTRGRPAVDVLATLDDGSTREFRLRGRQIDRVAGILDDLGPDAPVLVGSPKALKRFSGEDDEEPDEGEGDFDFEAEETFPF